MDDFTHWPFVAAALIFASMGQTMKRTVFTWERIGDGLGVKRGLLWWGRKTLPLHPVFVGIAFGLVPGVPTSPDVPSTTAATCLYYAGAGVASTWIFDLLRGLLKNRGVELASVVASTAPPPPVSRRVLPNAPPPVMFAPTEKPLQVQPDTLASTVVAPTAVDEREDIEVTRRSRRPRQP